MRNYRDLFSEDGARVRRGYCHITKAARETLFSPEDVGLYGQYEITLRQMKRNEGDCEPRVVRGIVIDTNVGTPLNPRLRIRIYEKTASKRARLIHRNISYRNIAGLTRVTFNADNL